MCLLPTYREETSSDDISYPTRRRTARQLALCPLTIGNNTLVKSRGDHSRRLVIRHNTSRGRRQIVFASIQCGLFTLERPRAISCESPLVEQRSYQAWKAVSAVGRSPRSCFDATFVLHCAFLQNESFLSPVYEGSATLGRRPCRLIASSSGYCPAWTVWNVCFDSARKDAS